MPAANRGRLTMRNPPITQARVAIAPSMTGAFLLVSGATLALAIMTPRLVAQAMFGPLCSGHGSGWALHCPACYTAAVMAAVGSAILFRQARL